MKGQADGQDKVSAILKKDATFLLGLLAVIVLVRMQRVS